MRSSPNVVAVFEQVDYAKERGDYLGSGDFGDLAGENSQSTRCRRDRLGLSVSVAELGEHFGLIAQNEPAGVDLLGPLVAEWQERITEPSHVEQHVALDSIGIEDRNGDQVFRLGDVAGVDCRVD